MTTRVQFGSKLEVYGDVQEKIARMAMMQYVTEVGVVCCHVKVSCDPTWSSPLRTS